MDYIIGDKLIEEFRDGIFALRTRRFGTAAEIMIKSCTILTNPEH